VLAYNHIFLLVATLFLIGLPLVLLLRYGRVTGAMDVPVD
jgi:hypothetical protein